MPVEVYVGRIRSAVVLLLLSLLTAGIWALAWLYKLNNDLRKHVKTGINPPGRLVLFILVPVIGWFIAFYLTGRSVRRAQINAGEERLTVPVYAAIWGTFVPIIGWSFALAILQGGANRAWTKMTSHFAPERLGETRLQCPDCDTIFGSLLNPLLVHPATCPSCGRFGDV